MYAGSLKRWIDKAKLKRMEKAECLMKTHRFFVAFFTLFLNPQNPKKTFFKVLL